MLSQTVSTAVASLLRVAKQWVRTMNKEIAGGIVTRGG
jgi:hypothetical protein